MQKESLKGRSMDLPVSFWDFITAQNCKIDLAKLAGEG